MNTNEFITREEFEKRMEQTVKALSKRIKEQKNKGADALAYNLARIFLDDSRVEKMMALFERFVTVLEKK